MVAWNIGYGIGIGVVAIVVALLVMLIVAASRAAARAEDIVAGLQQTGANAKDLPRLSSTVASADRIVAAATAARTHIEGKSRSPRMTRRRTRR